MPLICLCVSVGCVHALIEELEEFLFVQFLAAH